MKPCPYCSDEIKKHIDLKGVPCEAKCDNCLARYSIKPLQDNIRGSV